MKQMQFADTDDRVSSMALGCLPFGTRLDRDAAFEFLDYYEAQGGNFIDTANNYSFWEPGAEGGESEICIGKWLRERGARNRVFLATKLGAYPVVGRDAFFNYKGDPWADCTQGLSRKVILEAVDRSLERLGTDRIDLLYAHVDDRRTPQEETLEAFAEVVRVGKVRYIGSSNFNVWRTVRARELSRQHGWPEYKAAQHFHTYFQAEKGSIPGMHDPLNEELLDYVHSGNPMTLLAYTPLLWGSYSQPEKYREIPRLSAFKRPQNEERRKRLEQVAEETGWTVNQVVYAWLLGGKVPVIPLVAASRLEHLKEDLAASDCVLSATQMATLDSLETM